MYVSACTLDIYICVYVHCNTLQHTATHMWWAFWIPICIMCIYIYMKCILDIYIYVHIYIYICIYMYAHCNILQHTTCDEHSEFRFVLDTHIYTYIYVCTLDIYVYICMYTATHCNTMQRTATHCNTHVMSIQNSDLYSMTISGLIFSATGCKMEKEALSWWHCLRSWEEESHIENPPLTNGDNATRTVLPSPSYREALSWWHWLRSWEEESRYGVATISRLLKIKRLFCKRAL